MATEPPPAAGAQSQPLPVTGKTVRNVNKLHEERLTFGDRAADALAKMAGSWRFIFSFLIVLGVWMLLNSVAFIKGWDPYPFILLNLVLSCLAAIQAPVIMMSQNRQEEHDRLKSERDFEIDSKAEEEIEWLQNRLDTMHTKLEQLYDRQVKELLKMQEEQMDILRNLASR